jgi:hypothetical protein
MTLLYERLQTQLASGEEASPTSGVALEGGVLLFEVRALVGWGQGWGRG